MSNETIFGLELRKLIPVIKCAKLLSQKYNVVVTNPPYMNSSGMNNNLSEYLKKNFPNSTSDLSMAFMDVCTKICDNGFWGMINIPVWMNLSSCTELRLKLIKECSLVSMLHIGRGIFGSDFGTCSFIFYNKHVNDTTSLIQRLYKEQGSVEPCEEKEKMFFNKDYIYRVNIENFLQIPNYTFSYSLSNNALLFFILNFL